MSVDAAILLDIAEKRIEITNLRQENERLRQAVQSRDARIAELEAQMKESVCPSEEESSEAPAPASVVPLRRRGSGPERQPPQVSPPSDSESPAE
jgi:cell division septum initiation protein DivIVA